MEKLKELPIFQTDEDIATFMEAHDGFELLDNGLAEIVNGPEFKRNKNIIVDAHILKLLDELVQSGICATPSEAIERAVHVYVMAVLPHSYHLKPATK
jgi:hypothetical protein